jgi:hypothetical protein
MNINNIKYLCVIVLFFTFGCQKNKPQVITTKAATVKPVISNDILSEIAQVTKPQSKIHVATSIMDQHTHMRPDVDMLENDNGGTLRLGKDSCLYIELDSGIRILPVIVGEYGNLLDYTKALNKKVIGKPLASQDMVDLTSSIFNESSIGWVTLPPHQQCDISRVHQYSRLLLDDGSRESIIEDSSYIPTNENKRSYIGVYSYPYDMYFGDVSGILSAYSLPQEGVLFTEKECLYIRYKNGEVVLPIFKTQRTYWQDGKKALRASGRDWQLGESYTFVVSSAGHNSNSDSKTIIPPHSSCNTKQVADVSSINTPAEFKQKMAVYVEKQKAEANRNK